ncbi:hypothetical protein C8R45DRAFT_1077362 [Mycena sanguinolenta]|nr:hypothetical protein C8R45DRAFT_1077362 [Mycena sanguinolenta]
MERSLNDLTKFLSLRCRRPPSSPFPALAAAASPLALPPTTSPASFDKEDNDSVPSTELEEDDVPPPVERTSDPPAASPVQHPHRDARRPDIESLHLLARVVSDMCRSAAQQRWEAGSTQGFNSGGFGGGMTGYLPVPTTGQALDCGERGITEGRRARISLDSMVTGDGYFIV